MGVGVTHRMQARQCGDSARALAKKTITQGSKVAGKKETQLRLNPVQMIQTSPEWGWGMRVWMSRESNTSTRTSWMTVAAERAQSTGK